jgi:hypothetical protein
MTGIGNWLATRLAGTRTARHGHIDLVPVLVLVIMDL